MRRTLPRLAAAAAAATASLVLGVGPAAAASPPPSTTGEHDCRVGAVCHPGLHGGDPEPGRNIGG